MSPLSPLPYLTRATAFALPAALLATPLITGAAIAGVGPQGGAPLSVAVSGLHSTKGRIIACLWRDKAGFPSCAKSRTALRVTLPVSATSMDVRFPDVAPGRYAVTIEHDENGDGKMGHNFIGMPTEGVGVSNNPGGMPGWDKSLFSTAPGGGGAIAVKMRYLFG